jgi:hypothetical protein
MLCGSAARNFHYWACQIFCMNVIRESSVAPAPCIENGIFIFGRSHGSSKLGDDQAMDAQCLMGMEGWAVESIF